MIYAYKENYHQFTPSVSNLEAPFFASDVKQSLLLSMVPPLTEFSAATYRHRSEYLKGWVVYDTAGHLHPDVFSMPGGESGPATRHTTPFPGLEKLPFSIPLPLTFVELETRGSRNVFVSTADGADIQDISHAIMSGFAKGISKILGGKRVVIQETWNRGVTSQNYHTLLERHISRFMAPEPMRVPKPIVLASQYDIYIKDLTDDDRDRLHNLRDTGQLLTSVKQELKRREESREQHMTEPVQPFIKAAILLNTLLVPGAGALGWFGRVLRSLEPTLAL